MRDSSDLTRQLTALAERRAPPLAPVEAVERRRPRPRRARRVTAGVLSAAVVSLVAGNTAYAGSRVTPVIGQPAVPGPAGDQERDRSGQYVAVGLGHDWRVWLAGDETGRSHGCVGLQSRDGAPPDRIPNDLERAGVENVLCAPPTNPAGYLIRLQDTQSSTLGFGYAPASSEMVRLTFRRRGPRYLRLLAPDKTITAGLYGKEAGLPIVAWVGPDPEGYSLKKMQATTSSGDIVAEVSF